jgi:exonuclease III
MAGTSSIHDSSEKPSGKNEHESTLNINNDVNNSNGTNYENTVDKSSYNIECYDQCKGIQIAPAKVSSENESPNTKDCLKTIIKSVSKPTKNNNLKEMIKRTYKTGDISIGHLNVRSLIPKIEELRVLLADIKLDILCISESYLDDTVLNSEVKVDGYQLVRNDRNRNGGGVLIYLRDSIAFKDRSDLSDKNVECRWIEIQEVKENPILIGCFYRPPSANLDYFNNMVNNIERASAENKEVVILGDFNHDYVLDETLHKNPMKYIEDLFVLTQLVTDKTRVTPTSSTTIDLILTSMPELHCFTGVHKITLSDHYLCYTIFKRGGKDKKEINHKYITYRDYKNFNEESFVTDIRNSNKLKAILNINDVNTAWLQLKEEMIKISDKHAPIKKIRVKQRNNPWVTPEIVKQMYYRDSLHRKATNNKNVDLWNQYKSVRNQITREIKVNRKGYYDNIIDEHKTNPRKFWQKLTKIVPGKINMQSVPKTMSAEDINIFFADIGTLTTGEFDSTVHQNLYWKGQKSIHTFKLQHVCSQKIEKLLKQLSSSSNTDVLGFDSKLLRLSSKDISPMIAHLVNISFQQSLVINDWKLARVTPIYKGKGDKEDPGNYRPISVICHFGKILEKVMLEQLVFYLDEHDFISQDQSAYLKNHSTQTSLHRVTEDWLESMNEGLITGVCFLDISKCFDSIDHDLLLKKLECYGIQSTELKWFTSYLSNRMQVTKCNNTISSPRAIRTGVPQGSVLGPFLFLLFANDLSSFVNGGQINCFADDTIIYVSGETVAEVTEKLQKCLHGVQVWYNRNKLKINATKSNIMLLGTPQRLKFMNQDEFIISFDGVFLKRENCVKYLGVTIDSNLSWDQHISIMCKTIAHKIAILRRLRGSLSKNLLCQVYSTYIQPLFEYGCTLWGNTSDQNLNKLQRLQNSAARIVEGCFDYIDTRGYDIVKKLGWPDLNERRNYLLAGLMFKCINGNAPRYLTDLIVFIRDVTTRQNRNHDLNLIIPRPNIDKFKSSLFYRGAMLWNMLDSDLKECDNVRQFKKMYKAFYDI